MFRELDFVLCKVQEVIFFVNIFENVGVEEEGRMLVEIMKFQIGSVFVAVVVFGVKNICF